MKIDILKPFFFFWCSLPGKNESSFGTSLRSGFQEVGDCDKRYFPSFSQGKHWSSQIGKYYWSRALISRGYPQELADEMELYFFF